MDFFVTIILGIIFILLQATEYYEASYIIADGVYASVFYMLTGLHGSHVIIGIIFLIVCFFKVIIKSFFNKALFGINFCNMVLTFCRCYLNFIIFNCILLG